MSYSEASINYTLYSSLVFASKLSFGQILDLLYGAKTAFTRSAITPPKVNRFGWSLEHSDYIVGSWAWQILGAIRAVATAWEPAKIVVFLSGKQRTILPIIRRTNVTKFGHNHVDRCRVKNFRYRIFKNFCRNGSFFQNNATISRKFLTSFDFRPP